MMINIINNNNNNDIIVQRSKADRYRYIIRRARLSCDLSSISLRIVIRYALYYYGKLIKRIING